MLYICPQCVSHLGEVYAVSWSNPIHLSHMLFVSFIQFDLHEAVQELDISVSAVLYAFFIWNRIFLYILKWLIYVSRYTRKCARDEDIAVCSLHVDCISVNDVGNYTCHMDNSDDYEQGGVKRSVFLNLKGKHSRHTSKKKVLHRVTVKLYISYFNLFAGWDIETICTRHVTELGHNTENVFFMSHLAAFLVVPKGEHEPVLLDLAQLEK